MASKKITARTAATSSIKEDILGLITDPSGTPTDKKITKGNFLKPKVTTVAAATYSVATDDDILHVTYTATGAVAITLTSAWIALGYTLDIKDAGGNASSFAITIQTEGAETIDGSATATISTDYTCLSLYSDGSNVFIR